MTAATRDGKPTEKPSTVTARPRFTGCATTCICRCGNQMCACHEKDTT